MERGIQRGCHALFISLMMENNWNHTPATGMPLREALSIKSKVEMRAALESFMHDIEEFPVGGLSSLIVCFTVPKPDEPGVSTNHVAVIGPDNLVRSGLEMLAHKIAEGPLGENSDTPVPTISPDA